MAGLTDARNRKLLYALLIVVALVNLPLVHSTWTSARVDREGVDVTAELVGSRVLGRGDDARYWVSYRLPDDIDPGGGAWPAEVERATYDRIQESGEVRVRVLRDNPAAADVQGEVSRRAGTWSTLVVDAVLAVLVVLFWRHRRRALADRDERGEDPEDREDGEDGPQEARRSW